jgi:hypothetical protein
VLQALIQFCSSEPSALALDHSPANPFVSQRADDGPDSLLWSAQNPKGTSRSWGCAGTTCDLLLNPKGTDDRFPPNSACCQFVVHLVQGSNALTLPYAFSGFRPSRLLACASRLLVGGLPRPTKQSGVARRGRRQKTAARGKSVTPPSPPLQHAKSPRGRPCGEHAAPVQMFLTMAPQQNTHCHSQELRGCAQTVVLFAPPRT